MVICNKYEPDYSRKGGFVLYYEDGSEAGIATGNI